MSALEHQTKKNINIIYIYADDLGRGMLSCYGQKHFKTPNIDRLAQEGIRFTNSYGCAVCAPARASLLTGYHDCHAGKWSYTRAGIYKDLSKDDGLDYQTIRELINNTSYNERPDEVFLATIAKRAGLVTGEIGKLEWGFATTPERIEAHDWDYHFGYYDHARCHGFYPPFLFENGEKVDIPGNTDIHCGATYIEETPENRKKVEERNDCEVYSQDLFHEKIETFIRQHAEVPFFLYHPSQLPHGPTAVPEVHPGVKNVDGLTLWEKEYVSMILRLDDTVGMIYNTLKELNILENTMIIFSADNGHESQYYSQKGRNSGNGKTLDGRTIDHIDLNYTSELTGDVFNGNDGMSGKKKFSLEGGVRIPYIVRMPDASQAGMVSDHLIANYDTMPTIAEALGQKCPDWKDGLSFFPTLEGQNQSSPDHVVFAGNIGPALVTPDGWKVRYLTPVRRFQLFFLPNDYQEKNNLADQKPEKLKEMATKLLQCCDGNMYHGTWENHKSVRVDELLDGRGPEEAFPKFDRWQSPQS